MTQQQAILVQKTWKMFHGIKPEIIGDVFYSKLFTERPALKKMFKHPMIHQYKKLVDMFCLIVSRLQNLEELTDDISQLAKRHVGYGVKPAHYKYVGDALLWTLEHGLGKDWNEEVRDAWQACYKNLSATMINASAYTENSKERSD